jgi:hypothetical protein
VKTNGIVYLEAAILAASLVAAALLAAHAHGRRQERRAWLTERGNAS